MKKLIATLAIVGAMGTSGLFAQTGDSIEDLSITSSFAYESQYVFRGIKYNYDSFQPSLEFGYPVVGGDLYTGIWTNLPITSSGLAGATNEIDIYAGYAYPITDIVTLDAGFTYYWYVNAPNIGVDATNYVEPYIGASFDVLLSPAIYVYYSVDQLTKDGGDGPDSGIFTIEASIGYSFDLSEYMTVEGLSFDTGAYVGYYLPQDTSAMGAQGAFYGGVTGDLVYAFNENVSASIGVRYSNFSQNGQVAGGSGIPNQNNIWMGASVGFTY